MQIGVIGINHKQAQIELREAVAKVCTRRFGPGNSVHGEHAFILLTTCNRTEVYFSSNDLAETQSYILSVLKNDLPFEIGQELYSFFGTDCFYHLSKVTSGFDSAILAETEIQGQVKSSYQQAHQYLTLPFELHYLFQKALKVGKEIRTKLTLPKTIVDIEHAILHLGKNLPSTSKLLFIGASRTNLKIASTLRKDYPNITFTNRTNATTLKLTALEPYRYLPWEEKHLWATYDWVIVATKADTFQLHVEDLEASLATRLLIDLSVPRNIDPQLSAHIPLINIDQVTNLLQHHSSLLRNTLCEAEMLLEENANKYISLFHTKSDRLYAFA